MGHKLCQSAAARKAGCEYQISIVLSIVVWSGSTMERFVAHRWYHHEQVLQDSLRILNILIGVNAKRTEGLV